jgi:AraC-like DNA-binding protein
LPAVTVVEINDPTAIGEAMELVEQDVVQLDSKPMRFRRIIVRLKTAMVVHQSTNRPGRGLNKLQDGHVAFVAFGPRAAGTLNGMALGPDRVMASPSGIEVEFVVEAGYDSVAFLLPRDDFDAHLTSKAGQHECLFPQSVHLLQTGLVAARRLYGFGRRLVDLAARKPDLFEQPATRSAAEGELFDTLFAILESTNVPKSTARDRTRQSYSQVVQVAQRYALEHTAEPLRIRELCEATGVSERTLQYAFKQVLGMSPVTYLNRLRLHRVRRTLRAADPEATTVTDVALRWGFWHVGDFSQAYKNCFGELPSDTLRRRPPNKSAGQSFRGDTRVPPPP